MWKRWWPLATIGLAVAAAGMSLPPDIVGAPVFAAIAAAACMQALILGHPRVLWMQFERPVTWEDVVQHNAARIIVLGVSDVVTVAGFAVCVWVLRGRYSAGDLLSMSTVAEVGSTLFLVKQAQAAAGRPALALGGWLAARRRAALAADMVARPTFDVV